MDYEKKYKEVWEGVKKIHSGIKEVLAELGDSNIPLANILNEAVWALNRQFPELAESEDERTRKELIHFILYRAGRILLDKETEHRFVAYLEKQKEQKSSWKPSEEQMSMLLAVILDPNNAGSESCHLAIKSLYEDLKKL